MAAGGFRKHVVVPDLLQHRRVVVPSIVIHMLHQPLLGPSPMQIPADVLIIRSVRDAIRRLVADFLGGIEDPIRKLVEIALFQVVGFQEPDIIAFLRLAQPPEIAGVLAGLVDAVDDPKVEPV